MRKPSFPYSSAMSSSSGADLRRFTILASYGIAPGTRLVGNGDLRLAALALSSDRENRVSWASITSLGGEAERCNLHMSICNMHSSSAVSLA